MTAYTNIGRRLELVAGLLDHEATTGRGMGVVSVAARVEREKSQISRGLAALANEGLVGRDRDSLEFSVGPALLVLAARAGEPELVRGAMPVLERLGAVTGERVDLAVLHDGQVLTIESVASSSTVQSVGWVGRRTPVHCTAAGRVLLATLPASEVTALVGPSPLPPSGPNGPRSRAELMRRIDTARRDGWALADGELDGDVMAIAAPIVAADGRAVAAVMVSGPTFRMRSTVDAVVAAVRRAADELSARQDGV